MHFQKQDLEGTHYNWLQESKQNIFTGQPTRRVFDPFSGDQVLFLINFYSSLSEQHTIKEGREMEYDLIHHLPMGRQSEISVFNWLRSMSRRQTRLSF